MVEKGSLVTKHGPVTGSLVDDYPGMFIFFGASLVFVFVSALVDGLIAETQLISFKTITDVLRQTNSLEIILVYSSSSFIFGIMDALLGLFGIDELYTFFRHRTTDELTADMIADAFSNTVSVFVSRYLSNLIGKITMIDPDAPAKPIFLDALSVFFGGIVIAFLYFTFHAKDKLEKKIKD